MVLSGDILFYGLIVMAIFLTMISLKTQMVLFRIAPALVWLSLGIALLTNAFVGLTVTTGWTQILGFVFLIMTIAPLTLQMGTDIKHEKSVQGKFDGYPGAKSSSWKEWGPKPKDKEPTANELSNQRQAAYKQELRRRLSNADKQNKG